MDSLIKKGGGKPKFTYLGTKVVACVDGSQTINLSVTGATVGKRYLVVVDGYNFSNDAFSVSGLDEEYTKTVNGTSAVGCGVRIGIATSTRLGSSSKSVYCNVSSGSIRLTAYLIS